MKIFEYCPKCEAKWELNPFPGDPEYDSYSCKNCGAGFLVNSLTKEKYDYVWSQHQSAQLYYKDPIRFKKCGQYMGFVK